MRGKNEFYDCKCANLKCKANQTRESVHRTPPFEQPVEKPKRRIGYNLTILNDPDNVRWNTKNADEYWSRSKIRTYPNVANASGILHNEIIIVPKRDTLIGGSIKHYKRRDFGSMITKSYLDDFF